MACPGARREGLRFLRTIYEVGVVAASRAPVTHGAAAAAAMPTAQQVVGGDIAPAGARFASQLAVRNRMKSVRSIQKITKAMKMVAASKLRGVQGKTEQSRGMWQPFTALLGDNPTLVTPRTLVIAVSTDRGLCGGINSTVVKHSRAVSAISAPSEDTKSVFVILGEKAKLQLQRDANNTILMTVADTQKQGINFTQTSMIVDEILKNVEFDTARIIYNRFNSVVAFVPTVSTVLSPETLLKEAAEGGSASQLAEYEIEGEEGQEELFQNLSEFQLASTLNGQLLPQRLRHAWPPHSLLQQVSPGHHHHGAYRNYFWCCSSGGLRPMLSVAVCGIIVTVGASPPAGAGSPFSTSSPSNVILTTGRHGGSNGGFGGGLFNSLWAYARPGRWWLAILIICAFQGVLFWHWSNTSAIVFPDQKSASGAAIGGKGGSLNRQRLGDAAAAAAAASAFRRHLIIESQEQAQDVSNLRSLPYTPTTASLSAAALEELVRKVAENVSQRIESHEAVLVNLGIKLLNREQQLSKIDQVIAALGKIPPETIKAVLQAQLDTKQQQAAEKEGGSGAGGAGEGVRQGGSGQAEAGGGAEGEAWGELPEPIPPPPKPCKRQKDLGRSGGKVVWRVDGGEAEGEERPRKYLLAMCSGGQLSNRISCLRQHFLDAALLNRTLVFPSHGPGVDYDYERLLDMEAPRRCFGNQTFLTLDEYAAIQEAKHPRMRKHAPVMTVDVFICHVHHYQTERECGYIRQRSSPLHLPPPSPLQVSVVAYPLCQDSHPGEVHAKPVVQVPLQGVHLPLYLPSPSPHPCSYQQLHIHFAKTVIPEKRTPSPWFKYPSKEFISLFNYDDSVIAFGNMFGVSGQDLRFHHARPLVVLPGCKYYIMPSPMVRQAAAGFINSYLGSSTSSSFSSDSSTGGDAAAGGVRAAGDGGAGGAGGGGFMALHMRRGDFYQHCVNMKGHSKFACYHPIRQLAACVARRLDENPGVRAIYLSTNGDDDEVRMFREFLAFERARPRKYVINGTMEDGRVGSVVRVRGGRAGLFSSEPVPVVRMSIKSLETQPWAEPLVQAGAHNDSVVISYVEKAICVMSNVFFGTYGSTFTGDIVRLRDWLFLNSCNDGMICPETDQAELITPFES
ncbi:unnamed protein product [Closterium sp. Yama58-4]|nr:unnamed protein product [Closterium sp. Yama58-4]